jgi:hypothetical protein
MRVHSPRRTENLCSMDHIWGTKEKKNSRLIRHVLLVDSREESCAGVGYECKWIAGAAKPRYIRTYTRLFPRSFQDHSRGLAWADMHMQNCRYYSTFFSVPRAPAVRIWHLSVFSGFPVISRRPLTKLFIKIVWVIFLNLHGARARTPAPRNWFDGACSGKIILAHSLCSPGAGAKKKIYICCKKQQQQVCVLLVDPWGILRTSFPAAAVRAAYQGRGFLVMGITLVSNWPDNDLGYT